MIVFLEEKKLLEELVQLTIDLCDENKGFENFDQILSNYSHYVICYRNLDQWIQRYKNMKRGNEI